MNKAKTTIRVLLGLMIVVFGLNKFLQFIPIPPMSDSANEFMVALVKSGYIMTIVATVEIIGGLLLLVNKYLPLVLIIIFPVLLNAFLFHLFLDIAGIGGALLAIIMNIFLMFTNIESYTEILKP